MVSCSLSDRLAQYSEVKITHWNWDTNITFLIYFLTEYIFVLGNALNIQL